ncbi:SpoVG family protein, partial [bacterium]|nr:SpoVG family protein [bacterium]
RKDGKYQDVAHPITSDMRQRLEKAIVENYKKAIAEKSREAASAPSDAREPAVAETAVQAPPPEVPQPPAEEQK